MLPGEVYWIAGLVAAAGLVAVAAIAAFARGRPPWRMPPQRNRAVPWLGGMCFTIAIVLWLPPSIVAAMWLGDVSKLSPESRLPVYLAASLACLPLQVWLSLRLLNRGEGMQIPPGGGSYIRSIALGWAAWLPVVVATAILHLAVRWLATQYGSEGVSDHTLLETLHANPNSRRLWLLIAGQAIVCAPIIEEIFFRGCLQPWLVNRRWGGDLAVVLGMVAAVGVRQETTSTFSLVLPAVYIALAGCAFWMAEGPLLAVRNFAGGFGTALVPDDVGGRTTYRAVVGAALLFAAVHSSSWPDTVPLTVTGLGFGWLAWRTQGIVASTVCHMLFNATMLAMMRIWVLTPVSAG
ncbi:MAG: CPBP family intramembrane metalloprotease [Gemmataceae bacterium]|nr:CPBP family intramembrane metalloprotease [Gemmataceae bacterium]